MAIPGVVSQILLLLYNMVDRIYLGRLNDGGTALLAVALSAPVSDVISVAATMVFFVPGSVSALFQILNAEKRR